MVKVKKIMINNVSSVSKQWLAKAVLGASLLLAVGVLPSQNAAANVLTAGTTTNNGGGTGWGEFFNLTSLGSSLSVTQLDTFSDAAAGTTYSVTVYTRAGTALGGAAATGPGSSLSGWISLGSVSVTQGSTSPGLSLPIDIPDISVPAGTTVGTALVFTGAGPAYSTVAALTTYADSNLSLLTGDVRNSPFTATGSYFTPRAYSGSFTYSVVPEPSTLALLGVAACAMATRGLRSRRQ